MTEPSCANCLYCAHGERWQRLCWAPLQRGITDKIYLCDTERAMLMDSACGPEGRHFQAKPPSAWEAMT